MQPAQTNATWSAVLSSGCWLFSPTTDVLNVKERAIQQPHQIDTSIAPPIPHSFHFNNPQDPTATWCTDCTCLWSSLGFSSDDSCNKPPPSKKPRPTNNFQAGDYVCVHSDAQRKHHVPCCIAEVVGGKQGWRKQYEIGEAEGLAHCRR